MCRKTLIAKRLNRLAGQRKWPLNRCSVVPRPEVDVARHLGTCAPRVPISPINIDRYRLRNRCERYVWHTVYPWGSRGRLDTSKRGRYAYQITKPAKL